MTPNDDALRCAEAIDSTHWPEKEVAAHIRRLVAENEALTAQQPAPQPMTEPWSDEFAYHKGRALYEASVGHFRQSGHKLFWELTSIQQAGWVAKAARAHGVAQQPAPQPLTYQQMEEVIQSHAEYNIAGWRVMGLRELMAFIQRIERAHGIGEQP